MHELLELAREDKLGFALVLILLAFLVISPAHLLRTWLASRRKGVSPESGKRLAFLEAERERLQGDRLRRIDDVREEVRQLEVKVNGAMKDIAELFRRADRAENTTEEFRKRLHQLEITAAAFARDARLAWQSLEPVPTKEV